ncbi:hypothetical protein [Clostridium folliculivorans]|uniref:hypothetical protein n=1 Tax=Clostridium folliculivorans TaxID=2886038 RepID=UPI0021C428D8|nr:hypothetical protein [Clostridium folliculivorans]GKU28663.1 hypothetical protein CFB3_07690 [Clostridium folliculivorans]
MGKPSIFSKEYERKMKRRKRLVSILILVAIVIGALAFTATKINFNNDIKNKVSSIFKSKTNKDKSTTSNDKVINEKETATKPKDDSNKDSNKQSDSNASKDTSKNNNEEKKQDEDKYIEVTLGSGTVSKVFYDEVAGAKKYKYLDPIDGGVTFDISPSQSSILINEVNTQQLKVIGSDGQQKEITKASYVTKDGRTFSRESIMKQYPGYLWSVNGKFIDDNHVAYVSQLPWFGVPDLYSYIWIVDINSGEHKALMNTKAKSLTISNLAADGLHIKADDAEKVITVEQLISG